MKELLKILTRTGVLPHLPELLGTGDKCYLVGGALRDLLLKREVKDFDFATPGDPTRLAQAFAGRIGGRWFMLDAERRQSRVVRKQPDEVFVFDFAPFRGPDLEADLRGRDFTVNALACAILPGQAEPVILDPLEGVKDLAQRLLRGCSATAFLDDPLRVLRGVRHSVALGFRIEAATLERMSLAAPRVADCAPERIREEMAATFNAESTPEGYSLWARLGLLETLFGPATGVDSCARACRSVERAEAVFRELTAGPDGAAIRSLLGESLTEGFTRIGLLRLAAFLRGYALRDPARVFASRWRLGRRAETALDCLAQLPEGAGEQLCRLPAYQRGRALWASSLGPAPIEALLFLPIISEEARGSLADLQDVLKAYLDTSLDGRIADLVDGQWLIENLGLKPGPTLGRLLQKVRDHEVSGHIQDREDAMRFLAREGKKIIDKG